MLQTLFPGEYSVFQDDNTSASLARCIQTRLDEHGDEVEHITGCPKFTDLNNIESLQGSSLFLLLLNKSSYRTTSSLCRGMGGNVNSFELCA